MRSPRRHAVAVLAVAICGCVHVNHTRILVECQVRMEKLSSAILKYVEEHGDVPRDEDKKFTVEPILCDQNSSQSCVHVESARCNLADRDAPAGTGFVVASDLTADHVRAIRTNTHPFVLMCHDDGLMHRRTTTTYALLLVSTGEVRHWKVSKEEYAKWLNEEFKEGNYEIPEGLMKRHGR